MLKSQLILTLFALVPNTNCLADRTPTVKTVLASQGSGHIAFNIRDVAIFAFSHCPLFHRLIENLTGETVRIV